MSTFTNPIPRTPAPQVHESSWQRSPRDHDAVPRAWQLHRTTAQQAFSNAQNLEQIQRQLNRLRRRSSPTSSVTRATPFQISRVYDADPAVYKYQVGDGILITTGEPVDLSATLNTPFTLSPSVEFNWFYLDIADATTAVVTTSSVAVAWSSTVIPIGWVDLSGVEADPVVAPVIHQFVHDNIFCPCVT